MSEPFGQTLVQPAWDREGSRRGLVQCSVDELMMEHVEQGSVDARTAPDANHPPKKTSRLKAEEARELGVETLWIVYVHRDRALGSDAKPCAEGIVGRLQTVEHAELESSGAAVAGIVVDRDVLTQDEVTRSPLGKLPVGASVASFRGERQSEKREQDG